MSITSQVHGCTSQSMYVSPNIKQNESSLSIGFHNVPVHKVHFLVGVSITGRIPLVEWVDHLGLPGIAAEPLVMEGCTYLWN